MVASRAAPPRQALAAQPLCLCLPECSAMLAGAPPNSGASALHREMNRNVGESQSLIRF
jgi:hypothetical protein